MQNFKQKFNIKDLTIIKIGSWIISLRPDQITIGSLLLSLDRPCQDIGDITELESVELGQAFKAIKNLYSKTLAPDKINYLLLMMVDKQVHFHVIPRYANETIFDESTFKDHSWPKPVEIFNTLNMSKEKLKKLLSVFIRATK